MTISKEMASGQGNGASHQPPGSLDPAAVTAPRRAPSQPRNGRGTVTPI